MNAPVLGCSGYSVFNRASAGVRILNGAAGRCGNRLFGSYPSRAASSRSRCRDRNDVGRRTAALDQIAEKFRSEEHTSELQSLMRISYAVFCLKNTTNITYK